MTPHRILTSLGTALLIAATVTGWLSPNGASAASTTVDVADDQFVAANITITVGDTVTWDWTDSNQHTVTFDDGSTYSSGIQSQPFTSPAIQFTTVGTFAYYCQVHGAPGGTGMSGTVVVQAAATNTATATGTNTPAATSTPGIETSTPESTNTATGTPVPSMTAIGDTPTIAVVQSVAAVPTSSDGAGPAAELPRTGRGPSERATPWTAIFLAVGAMALIAGALVGRRPA
jgi:plastocyanin